MLSVASLLNPTPSGRQIIDLPSNPTSSSYPTSSSPQSSHIISEPHSKKQKMAKDGAVFIKGKPKGQVNFRPFENLDKGSINALSSFHITPFGKIEDYPRHIPYNSDKKDFLKKTGRESFEVFQYNFKVPNSDKQYLVLWDYNIGLVRITPFFKCCNYSKTTPAKMLNLNPGLKEITHSITGGSLSAQGYWMPYSCAYAICATFCAHISGALIPIFGPHFPSHCIPTSSPHYGRMVIDPAIIAAASHEAHASAMRYTTLAPPTPSFPPSASHPLHISAQSSESPIPRSLMSTPSPSSTPGSHFSKRLRLKRTYRSDSPVYITDRSDADASDRSPGPDGYITTPLTPISTFPSTPISHPIALPHSRFEWTSTPHTRSVPMSPVSPLATPPASSAHSGSRIELPRLISFGMSEFHSQSNQGKETSQRGRGTCHRNTLSCSANPFLSAIPRSMASDSHVYNNPHHNHPENLWRPVATSPALKPNRSHTSAATNTSTSVNLAVSRKRHPEYAFKGHNSPDHGVGVAHRNHQPRTYDRKGRKSEVDSDYDFCEESASPNSSRSGSGGGSGSGGCSPSDAGYVSGDATDPPHSRGGVGVGVGGLGGAEKNAALLLMKLSVTDCGRDAVIGSHGLGIKEESDDEEVRHRVKRRRGRATSV